MVEEFFYNFRDLMIDAIAPSGLIENFLLLENTYQLEVEVLVLEQPVDRCEVENRSVLQVVGLQEFQDVLLGS